MVLLFIPKNVRNLADNIKHHFEKVGIPYSILCYLICFYVFMAGNLSVFVRWFVLSPSVSWLSYSINKVTPRLCDSLMLQNARMVMSWAMSFPDYHKRFHLAVDTTSSKKHSSIAEGCGSWFTSSRQVYFGFCIVMFALVDTHTGTAYPLFWKRCLKKEEAGYQTCFDIILSFLQRFLDLKMKPLPVVFDSWFDSAPFMKSLEDLGFKFVIEIKSNRKVRIENNKNAQNFSLIEIMNIILSTTKKKIVQAGTWINGKKTTKYTISKIIYLPNRKDGRNSRLLKLLVVMVFNSPDSPTPFSYYVTNDLSSSDALVWKLARGRWNIEVLFRNLKQYLGWGQAPFQSLGGIMLSITLPLVIATFLLLKSSDVWGLNDEEVPTLGQKIAWIRSAEQIRSIQSLWNGKVDKEVINRFLNRRDPLFAHKKPANIDAGKRKRTKIIAKQGKVA